MTYLNAQILEGLEVLSVGGVLVIGLEVAVDDVHEGGGQNERHPLPVDAKLLLLPTQNVAKVYVKQSARPITHYRCNILLFTLL